MRKKIKDKRKSGREIEREIKREKEEIRKREHNNKYWLTEIEERPIEYLLHPLSYRGSPKEQKE